VRHERPQLKQSVRLSFLLLKNNLCFGRRESLDVDALVAFLIQNGRKWIIDQCEFHHPHSVPLVEREIEILKMFYRKATIERTRIRHVPRIENPPFYTELARVGISVPLDFSQMAGMKLPPFRPYTPVAEFK